MAQKTVVMRYSDERDKAYGLAGAVITVVMTDRARSIADINLDAAPGECVTMSHDFGFKGNPRMSAKIVWEQAVDDLGVLLSMVLGNLACRRYLLSGRDIDPAEITAVRTAFREEACDNCGLDADEADRLFNRSLAYVNRVFSYPAIPDIARAFAENLAECRSLSIAEALDYLSDWGIR